MEQRPRILVVDDEPRSLELLVRTLRRSWQVVTAPSASAAWTLIEEQPYDLILTDQRMPGMTGVDLLTRVAERDEHTGRILLTGYSDLEATVEAINRGRVHAYLHKPCSPEDIRLTTQAVLERSRLGRENERLVRLVSEQNESLRRTLAELEGAQRRLLASERLAAVGKAVAMIAHDVRTPLTVLLSTAAALREVAAGRSDGEIGALGEAVAQQAEQVKHSCDELLEATRATEVGRPRIETSLDDVVADAALIFAPIASRVGVEIDLQLGAPLDLLLEPYGLRRAVQNLAMNGIEAMVEGGALRIRTEIRDGRARIQVVDNGPGIPQEIADRLFEPFVTSGKARGCGLGLAVVRKVVEDHGGDVAVSKPDGGGACFEISLPVPEAARVAHAS